MENKKKSKKVDQPGSPANDQGGSLPLSQMDSLRPVESESDFVLSYPKMIV